MGPGERGRGSPNSPQFGHKSQALPSPSLPPLPSPPLPSPSLPPLPSPPLPSQALRRPKLLGPHCFGPWCRSGRESICCPRRGVSPLRRRSRAGEVWSWALDRSVVVFHLVYGPFGEKGKTFGLILDSNRANIPDLSIGHGVR